MEGKTSAGEPPKYYNERQRDAMQRYRKKRKTIQLSLTFKVWKKALMEQQAAKRGLSMNKYFLGMMEKDAQGMVYIIPDMNRNEAIARISEIEVLDDDLGAPHVTLHGSLLEHARERGMKDILISLSSDGDYALAFAAAQTGASPMKGKDE